MSNTPTPEQKANWPERRWHEKKRFIIAALVLFFPLGLYLVYKNRLWSQGEKIGIGVGFFVVVIIFSNLFAAEEGGESAATAASDSTAIQEQMTQQERLANWPLRKRVVWAAVEELGEEKVREVRVHRQGDGYYRAVVEFTASNNLTASWVKRGILTDAQALIKTMSAKAVYDSVRTYRFTPYFTMVDKYGNESVVPVGRLELSQSVARRVNWENMHVERFKRLVRTEGDFWLRG